MEKLFFLNSRIRKNQQAVRQTRMQDRQADKQADRQEAIDRQTGRRQHRQAGGTDKEAAGKERVSQATKPKVK
jgi:hypothetical protein